MRKKEMLRWSLAAEIRLPLTIVEQSWVSCFANHFGQLDKCRQKKTNIRERRYSYVYILKYWRSIWYIHIKTTSWIYMHGKWKCINTVSITNNKKSNMTSRIHIQTPIFSVRNLLYIFEYFDILMVDRWG